MESSFAIIAEPNRRAILSLLPSSERSVGEIERQLRMPQTVRVQAPPRAARGRLRGGARRSPAARLSAPARAAHGGRRLAGAFPALLDGPRRCARTPSRSDGAGHPRKGREAMSNREKYAPGPAAGAEVRKDGEKWTLVLVRDLRHPPAKVWQALTDPEHLREWAPFDADRNLGTRGHREALDGGGADAARLRDRGEAGRRAAGCSSTTGAAGPPLGARAAGRRRHAAHALAQHRPRLHLDGRRGLAHLLRRAGSASRRSAHWTHRRPRGHEVRRLAAIERRVRKAVRRRDPRLALSPRS